jgi:hypothetical protein
MKKILIVAALALTSGSLCFAQGTLNFQNGGPGVNAIVNTAAGAPAEGSSYMAELWWGADVGSLVGSGITTAFGTGASAGYFFGGVATLPGTTTGQSVFVQARAWDATGGATDYATAANAPSGFIGESNIIPITLGGSTTPPPFMVGLDSFNLHPVAPVPEPATFALAGLGAVALLLFRRRK